MASIVIRDSRPKGREMSEALQVGDRVAIRGDRRWNYLFNRCQYAPEQLVDGQYVKKPGTNEIWTGTITGFTADGEHARLGNSRAAWAVRLLEKIGQHTKQRTTS